MMKQKRVLIILTAVISLSVIAYGFGAWSERLSIGISIKTADAFPSTPAAEATDEISAEQAEKQEPSTEGLAEASPKPSRKPARPSKKPAEPAEEPAEPSEEAAEPSEEAAEPSEEAAEPAEEAAEPSEEAEEPSEEAAESSEELSKEPAELTGES